MWGLQLPRWGGGCSPLEENISRFFGDFKVLGVDEGIFFLVSFLVILHSIYRVFSQVKFQNQPSACVPFQFGP